MPLLSKFAASLLMLTVLVAQQLCTCAAAMPPARPASVAASGHDCCAAMPKAAEPARQHEPSCPHCGEARAESGTIVEVTAKADLAPRAAVAIVLLQSADLLSSLLAPAALPAAIVAPHAAGPPPDVLRVTGILLI